MEEVFRDRPNPDKVERRALAIGTKLTETQVGRRTDVFSTFPFINLSFCQVQQWFETRRGQEAESTSAKQVAAGEEDDMREITQYINQPGSPPAARRGRAGVLAAKPGRAGLVAKIQTKEKEVEEKVEKMIVMEKDLLVSQEKVARFTTEKDEMKADYEAMCGINKQLKKELDNQEKVIDDFETEQAANELNLSLGSPMYALNTSKRRHGSAHRLSSSGAVDSNEEELAAEGEEVGRLAAGPTWEKRALPFHDVEVSVFILHAFCTRILLFKSLPRARRSGPGCPSSRLPRPTARRPPQPTVRRPP